MITTLKKSFLALVLGYGLLVVAVLAGSELGCPASDDSGSQAAPQPLELVSPAEMFFKRIIKKYRDLQLLNITAQQWLDGVAAKLITRQKLGILTDDSFKRAMDILELLRAGFEMKLSIDIAVQQVNEAYRKFDAIELEAVNKLCNIMVETEKSFNNSWNQLFIFHVKLSILARRLAAEAWQEFDCKERLASAVGEASIVREALEAWYRSGFLEGALAERLIASFKATVTNLGALTESASSGKEKLQDFIVSHLDFVTVFAEMEVALQALSDDVQRRCDMVLKTVKQEEKSSFLVLTQDPKHRFIDCLNRLRDVRKLENQVDSFEFTRKFEEAFSKLENAEIGILAEILELPNLEV